MQCLEANNNLPQKKLWASSSLLCCYNATIGACRFGTAWQACMLFVFLPFLADYCVMVPATFCCFNFQFYIPTAAVFFRSKPLCFVHEGMRQVPCDLFDPV